MSYHEEEGSESESMMHELVNDPNLPNLMSNLNEELFPLATQTPEILNYNLISENRVVKLIKGSRNLVSSLIKGFYFQLFKLCFEMSDQQSTKDYLQITKNIIFDRSIIQQSNIQSHYKHLAQFFSLMEDEKHSFEQILSKYHEIDQALISIMEQLLQDRSQSEQSEEELVQLILNDLCELFQVTLIPNHPFYQFQESGLYLMFESTDRCFLVYDEDTEEEQSDPQEQQQEQESSESEKKVSNIKSQISVSEKSKNNSQITQNNVKNDGNFTKEYSFQPESRGEAQVYQNSNKVSEISNSINSKECNSRPVSNVSHKSHLSSESQYKRQETNRYQIKIQSKVIENNPISNSQRMDIPENQPPSYANHDPFKKGAFKISNPYEISSPFNFSSKIEDIPVSQKPSNHFFSPSPPSNASKEKQITLGESHYVNNSLSNYYEGYYADIPHNNSMQSVNSKNDTIINIFGDMLKSGKHDGSYTANSEQNIGNRATKKQIQETEQILETQEEFQKQDSSQIYPNFARKHNKMEPADMMARAKSVKSVNQHFSDFNSNSINGSKNLEFSIAQRTEIKQSHNLQNERKFSSNLAQKKIQSFAQGHSSSIENQAYLKNNQVVNFDEEESIFYKPKQSRLKAIEEVTASKQSINIDKKDRNDDSKGSIYRQFSDTRILKLLKEPHKTKVQIMRNRFKGQHFNL